MFISPRVSSSFALLLCFVGGPRGAAVGALSFPFFSSATATSPDVVSSPVLGAPKKVAVCGSTGRTGKLVVSELRKRNIEVVALVRDLDKAKENLPPEEDECLTVRKCDLGDAGAIQEAVRGCDATIWCATGFSDAPADFVTKVKSVLGIALRPKESIDAVGIPALARAYASSSVDGKNEGRLPKVVMLSSAGVTRPSWNEEKKEKLRGCADIPIVRLNPFGILDVKAESEKMLRESGTDYCIFRPCGLNDKWPSGSRPIFSQGDVAVGRINRADVAKILVECLYTPEATGKTFEGVCLKGYPAAPSIGPALSRLRNDAELLQQSEQELESTYALMQQLLPGETQDAAALAMGQTYEQLDKNEVGRLGERGKEDVEAAALKPSS